MRPSTEGFAFRVVCTDGSARRSILTTPHGDVDLPTFMPVGTQGSVKGLTPDEVASTGARIVLGNTYHLMLRPGAERIAELGGLHGFTRWPHAMLTDSGGFQAFSLSAGSLKTSTPSLVTPSEEGFVFRSHLDGSKHQLTPESAVEIQGKIGADIQMQLDVCPPGEAPRDAVERAVAMTTRWAERALATPRPPKQALFGIVQGGTHTDLRLRHAAELAAMVSEGRAFDGLALGGFSVGEEIAAMRATLDAVASALDPERPRYLMGVGTPQDLIHAIGTGVDMFDCVMPTRNARNGQAFTRFGKIAIKQARWATDPLPLDPDCSCPCCRGGFSRAYLRHLYLANEMLVLRLLTLHNLWLYGEIMRGARDAIERGAYSAWARETLTRMEQ